jgi:ornithine--oxo-acid transaminase
MSSATPPPPVGQILSDRSGEEMALNDRFLNPQMGRILRTLGFDKVWAGGDGAHLIDADGERYLDLFGGYGVFAIGRNHPEAIAAVREVMEARTGNLPQLGVTLLSGVLAEQLLERAPDSVAAMVPANTGTEAVEAAIKIARSARCRSTAASIFARASAPCCPAAIRCRSAISTRCVASWNAAMSRRS